MRHGHTKPSAGEIIFQYSALNMHDPISALSSYSFEMSHFANQMRQIVGFELVQVNSLHWLLWHTY